MLAIIGWIVLVVLGGFFLLQAGALFYASALFGSRKSDMLILLLPLALAGCLLYTAWVQAPFSVTFVGG